MKRLLLLTALTACATTSDYNRVAENLYAQGDTTPDYPQPDRTYVSYSFEHGYQIEYLGAHGHAFLWYPGNALAVQGDWQTLASEVCYRYAATSYNPATHQMGGKFDCANRSALSIHNVAQLPGDPFQLSSGRVPYARDRCALPPQVTLAKKVSCP